MTGLIRLLAMIVGAAALALWAGACGVENQLEDVAVCTGVIDDRCPEAMSVIPTDSPSIYTAGRLVKAVRSLDTRTLPRGDDGGGIGQRPCHGGLHG